MQVVYGIDGRQKLDEHSLDPLSGYENSRPVRIGNAAYQQLQLDIYGEMMVSIYLANKYGDAISYAGWRDVQRILDWLGKNWQRPDAGIWEVRSSLPLEGKQIAARSARTLLVLHFPIPIGRRQ